ncbi:phytoene desaturase [Jannaschia seohaensis]|uniref:Phytoene dehydrogenase n=1 Tax=Jannaschia seohaensis TaxID=475081 RepID=A0A2Y9A381_9RHOB|nr:phytoene desaturase [Jannaschia seohaensis]PWJ21690.1 phytoene desaturase [Jannaschia seohaensis]SSA37968.1 phytoene desaturase [Jannaschia seohaensis]
MTRHPTFEPTGRSRAVVIGAGLGGLAAAMRLGAKGWHVTVLDRLDTPGGRASSITSGGHRFDLGPTIVTAPEVFRRLFADCGHDFDAAIDLIPLDPFYTIRWPDGSHLAARAEDADMEAEIARLSPGDVAGWRRFLRDAEERYIVGYEGMLTKPMHRFVETAKVLPRFAMLRADRSILSLARSRVKDERLRMALSFHPLFIGGDPARVTSMYALVSHLEKTQGVHYAMGGVGAMARAMVDVIEGQGGEVRLGIQVDQVTQDARGRASGVRLTSGEEVASDIVVSNADAGHTYAKMLKGRTRHRWTDRKLGRARWSMGLFVWYFGTKGTRDMWPDLGHHTILSGPRYEGLLRDVFRRGHLSEDMSLYIHRPSVTDPSVAPPGDDTFYALSPVPHLGHRDPVDWGQEAESYRQKVQAVLERELMPGLGDHVTASMCLTPRDFRDRYLSPHGCGFSIEPRILQSAWFRPHNVSEEAPGLFLVGAGTHPGAGLPGVVASAEVLEQVVPPARRVETWHAGVARPVPQAAE